MKDFDIVIQQYCHKIDVAENLFPVYIYLKHTEVHVVNLQKKRKIVITPDGEFLTMKKATQYYDINSSMGYRKIASGEWHYEFKYV